MKRDNPFIVCSAFCQGFTKHDLLDSGGGGGGKQISKHKVPWIDGSQDRAKEKVAPVCVIRKKATNTLLRRCTHSDSVVLKKIAYIDSLRRELVKDI